jgi:hypothetical protein
VAFVCFGWKCGALFRDFVLRGAAAGVNSGDSSMT